MSKRQILQYNPKLKNRSRSLRRNMTEAEVKLWVHIRKKQVANFQFYRQRPIGNFIADFYCPEAHLVIEVDGGQHYQDEKMEYDGERDSYLQGLGLIVLRFSNLDVLQNIDGTISEIEHMLADITLTKQEIKHPSSSTQKTGRGSPFKGRKEHPSLLRPPKARLRGHLLRTFGPD